MKALPRLLVIGPPMQGPEPLEFAVPSTLVGRNRPSPGAPAVVV